MAASTDTKADPTNQARQAPSEDSDAKPVTTTATSTAQPLAPPPRPIQNSSTDTPDYFSSNHHNFSLEPNVFEASFGGSTSGETPGKTVLPPVANITSPSPIPGITPGWNSLRAGPLSPAMLTGPTQTDYFSESFRGFPTPNESSLRTGLTPGGGGSMFPVPSPGTQAIFQLQSGGVTPNTADFHQSALRAAAQASQTKFSSTSAPTSQAATVSAGMDEQANLQQKQQAQHQASQQPQQRSQQDPFVQTHDVSTAANDLLSFATQNGHRNGQHFAIPNQAQQLNNVGHMPVQPATQEQTRRNTKGSINSIPESMDTGDFSDSADSEPAKTATRSRAKKGGNTKTAAARKKAEETPKTNNKRKRSTPEEEDDDDMDMGETSPKAELNENGKKMTDEEKRKNFLERNRVAALKCRQRKKQWLANLQTKVELFSTENDALSATVTQLREEIVNLKTLLLAHKECPVSQAQGLGGMNMNSFLGGDMGHHQNPYGIAGMQTNGVQMGMPMQATAQMQNR